MTNSENLRDLVKSFDVERINSYLHSRTPKQLWAEVKFADLDPTDVLAFADVVLQFLENEEHAIPLYQVGLRELQEHPEKIASDTNLLGAWCRLFRLLAKRGRNHEAIEAYFMAESLGNNDPADKLVVALSLHAVGRFREALQIAEWLLKTRPEFEPGTIKSAEQAFALAKQLRAECLQHIT